MIYIRCLYILIMAFILSSCKGSNDYLFMNLDCNCKSYVINQDKFLLSIAGAYYLSDNINSEFAVEISNKTDETMLFNYKENHLLSQNFIYDISSSDTVFNILPKTKKLIYLHFNGRFKNTTVFPDKDDQILKINGLMNSNGKVIEVEDIRLVTTTWNY